MINLHFQLSDGESGSFFVFFLLLCHSSVFLLEVFDIFGFAGELPVVELHVCRQLLILFSSFSKPLDQSVNFDVLLSELMLKDFNLIYSFAHNAYFCVFLLYVLHELIHVFLHVCFFASGVL